jgi:hypothetical protein
MAEQWSLFDATSHTQPTAPALHGAETVAVIHHEIESGVDRFSRARSGLGAA